MAIVQITKYTLNCKCGENVKPFESDLGRPRFNQYDNTYIEISSADPGFCSHCADYRHVVNSKRCKTACETYEACVV